MKRIIAIALLFSAATSCQKDKEKEFAGNYLVQFVIHPGENSYLVPSSDTTTLWISSVDSTQPWQFSPVGKNQYSISPSGNNNRVLSANGSSISSSLSLHLQATKNPFISTREVIRKFHFVQPAPDNSSTSYMQKKTIPFGGIVSACWRRTVAL